MSDLEHRILAAAAAPVLLVASDFDGTLSPIVDRPENARVEPRAWKALRALAALPHTDAAIITGRARAVALSLLPGAHESGIAVIGSHGVEVGDREAPLDSDAALRLGQVRDLLYAESMVLPGSLVEVKPASAAFHVRMAAREPGDAALARLGQYAARMEGIHTVQGDRVVELSVLRPGKGAALAKLRHDTGAAATVFIGDDATDENAFAVLQPADLGIKIGPGPTVARDRVDSQAAVAGILERLLAARTAWLGSRTLTPIERHSILSDQRSIAIVDPRGSVVWACLPRIDSPPIFARLVGEAAQGEFSISPAPSTPAAPDPSQHYDSDSFTLQTVWPSPPAQPGARPLRLTDYFDCSGGRATQRPGRTDLVRVLEGEGRAAIRFAPRLDFGRVPTRLRAHPDGLEVEGWLDAIILRSPGVTWRIIDEGPHQTALAEVELSSAPVVLELRYGAASFRPAPLTEPLRREQSRRFWSSWAADLVPTTLHESLVRRSALTLKALAHGPTGAIAAAATTSLPEHLGGVRNWDYRYCWVRDACMTASSLVRIGNTGIGLRLLDWLVQVLERTDSPEKLRPLYTINGDHLGPEADISELAGYGGSRPVRVGNAASHQVQLDVFGPVVELVAMLAEAGAPVTPEQWRLVEAMIGAVEKRWHEPDHGIWEIRGPKRHHVHTKAMCWFAADRGLVIADRAMGLRRPAWEALRDRIAADINARGYSPSAGCFAAAYGEDAPDASCLLIGLCGLIPPADPRFVATVQAIERTLLEGPAVARYRADDGLPGREGAWIICATWLVESLALIGRADDARSLLDRVARLAGPTGLMAEEYDARHKIALGNFPQAYSHLGFINAVVRLDTLAAAAAAGAGAQPPPSVWV